MVKINFKKNNIKILKLVCKNPPCMNTFDAGINIKDFCSEKCKKEHLKLYNNLPGMPNEYDKWTVCNYCRRKFYYRMCYLDKNGKAIRNGTDPDYCQQACEIRGRAVRVNKERYELKKKSKKS